MAPQSELDKHVGDAVAVTLGTILQFLPSLASVIYNHLDRH